MQHDKLAAVVIRSGTHAGRRIPLLQGSATCGRSSDNDVAIKDDPIASAVHARLTCERGHWYIEDAGSTNGTFVETRGVRTRVSERVPLQPGQFFLVGRTLLMLCDTTAVRHPSHTGGCNDHCNEYEHDSQPPMHLRLEQASGKLRVSLLSENVLARDWTLPLPEEDLQELSGRVEQALAACRAVGSGSFREDLAKAGELLARHLLPERVCASLFAPATNRLVMSLTPSLIGVPWELAARDGRHLCLVRSVGRQILIDENECQFRSSPGCGKNDALVVADPAENLPETRPHAEAVAHLLRETWPSLRVTLLAGEKASRLEILQRLPEARIVYYAGHAIHDPADPESSGWILKNGRVTAQDFRRLAATPSFVFANGCQTSCENIGPQTTGWRHGMASGFILAGVHGYLGAAWPLPVEPALAFADAWFRELAAGATIGDCTQRARIAISGSTPSDAAWPAYTCYGNPAARLIF